MRGTWWTHGVGSVIGALEVHHAIETAEGGTMALITMVFHFLLGEDIAAALVGPD